MIRDLVLSRLYRRLKVTPAGCWEYEVAPDTYGYHQICIKTRLYQSHRVSYAAHVGFLAPDLTIDHLCRNRACVNPDHLEPTTIRVNTLRGDGPSAMAARKTHCVYGHRLPLGKVSGGRWRRRCKPCDSTYWQRTKIEKASRL